MNSFPYRNIVDLVELKGEDLAQVFEQVASLYDKEKPDISFLQVSGIFILCFKYHTKILKDKEANNNRNNTETMPRHGKTSDTHTFLHCLQVAITTPEGGS